VCGCGVGGVVVDDDGGFDGLIGRGFDGLIGKGEGGCIGFLQMRKVDGWVEGRF